MSAANQNVLDALKADEPELRRLGVRRLALFGSAARGEDRPDSDIDLLAAFDPTRRLSLLDIVHIENHLSDLLGRRVELVEEGCLRPRAQASADQDLVVAFS
jgi:predicted nucleotidyltransferase